MDPDPERHQVTELPKIKGDTIEYQLFSATCTHCGHRTRAQLPEGVPQGAFGPRVLSTVGLLTGAYHMSDRTARSAMSDLFGVDLSLGAIPSCQAIVSAAVEKPVEQAREYAQAQPVAHADETGWRESRKRAWLWLLATPLVAVFLIHAERSADAARALLGKFAGLLVTDRWPAYDFWPVRARQLCWSHLRRDFVKISERGGTSKRLGEKLDAEAGTMFSWWHRVRYGRLSRSTFRRKMVALQARVEAFLEQGKRCRNPRTANTCQKILEKKEALWTFVHVPGVEPTNNFGEQTIRQAVLWRKCSYGTQSKAGSRFVERMLTVTASTRLQHRNAVEYVTAAVQAHLLGNPSPSLLPNLAIPQHAPT
jgi:transposase